MRAPCRIDGCDRESRGRGLCGTHWARWRKHGDPMVVKRPGVDYMTKTPCAVEACDRLAHAHGFCGKHLRRWEVHGDPLIEVVLTGRPLDGDVPTIHAVHKRLSRGRGPASQFSCVDCGAPAQEWSYSGTDPEQLWGEAGGFLMPYSLDLAFYDPRCVSCHRKHDGAGNRPRTTKGRFKRSTNQAGVTA